MKVSRRADKGAQMEEVLREYFLDLGYYAVRGIKYSFEGFDVTDVDLWLYQRGSSFSRQRFNVDIKHKRTPQALERVLWAKGLQQCLRLDGAIVATTDTRKAVKKFADQNDVVLLDGAIVGRLKLRYGKGLDRLSEEELGYVARGEKTDRVGVEWLKRIATAKSRILSQLDFDGFNALLIETRFFASEMIADTHRCQLACRFFYFSLSMLIVVLDFILRDFAFIDRQLQADALNDGFRFGKVGKQGAEKVFTTAAKIVSACFPGERSRSGELIRQLRTESMNLPAEILTEFFLKANQGKALFDFARQFESAAYARELTAPAELSGEQRGLISVILDFHGIDRRKFFDSVRASSTKNSDHPTEQLAREPLAEAAPQQSELGMEPSSPGHGAELDEWAAPSKQPILPKTNVGEE
jgi:hypothetical protein